jgi:predicted dehydrogenase
MAHPSTLRLGIIGAGWPGSKHAHGAKEAGGWRLTAVADLIPDRAKTLTHGLDGATVIEDAATLIRDKNIDAVSIAVPNHLHADLAIAALRAGKHVLIEPPPTTTAKDARRLASAAQKSGRVILYAFQRRFGPAEQAARQAIAKGYAGDIRHVRAAWLRTRGIPVGTGWYSNPEHSGGGAMIDLGLHALDLAWSLIGQPALASVFAVTHPRDAKVEQSAVALLKFDGGITLELSAAWTLNQPPQQQGTQCRLFGDAGCVDVYTPHGAVIYRQFDDKGQSKPTELKPPKLVGYAALMRHFRECILGKSAPLVGATEGVRLMEIIEAIYKSAQTGKSVSPAAVKTA